jgi:hypothetical protein
MTCVEEGSVPMPTAPASGMSRRTIDPPPVSFSQRLRWLKPMMVWVTWCSLAKAAQCPSRIVILHLRGPPSLRGRHCSSTACGPWGRLPTAYDPIVMPKTGRWSGS